MWKSEIANVLRDSGYMIEEKEIEVPKDPNFGDFSFATFNLAKKVGKNPVELAREIVKKIQVSKYPFLIKVEAVNGYVNFFIYWEKLSEEILKRALEQKKTHFWQKSESYGRVFSTKSCTFYAHRSRERNFYRRIFIKHFGILWL